MLSDGGHCVHTLADKLKCFALACSEAPEGRERWSMRLLADKAVEMGIVESVSHETVRKTLKKTNFAPTSSRAG